MPQKQTEQGCDIPGSACESVGGASCGVHFVWGLQAAFLLLRLRHQTPILFSRISTRKVRRSSRTLVRRFDPNTPVHSSKGRLVVARLEPPSYCRLKTSQSGSGPMRRVERSDVRGRSAGEALKLPLHIRQLACVTGLHQFMDQDGGSGPGRPSRRAASAHSFHSVQSLQPL